MIALTTPSKNTSRLIPCPICQAPTTVEAVSKLESENEFTDFMALRLEMHP
jgi:hypothetical protein